MYIFMYICYELFRDFVSLRLPVIFLEPFGAVPEIMWNNLFDVPRNK